MANHPNRRIANEANTALFDLIEAHPAKLRRSAAPALLGWSASRLNQAIDEEDFIVLTDAGGDDVYVEDHRDHGSY